MSNLSDIKLAFDNMENSLQLITTTSSGTTSFSLFKEDWYQLQMAILKVYCLPIRRNSFVNTYGNFPEEEALVENCYAALNKLSLFMKAFGDVDSFNNYLADSSPTKQAKDVFGKIISLATDIVSQSRVYQSEFEEFTKIGAEEITQEERKELLKSIVLGRKGAIQRAEDMQGLCRSLGEEIGKKVLEYQGIEEDISGYASPEAKIYKVANDKAKNLSSELKSDVAELNDLEAAYSRAVGGSIGGSIGIALITPPPGAGILTGLAFGLGMGFGLAKKISDKIDKINKKIDAESEALKQKMKLVADLNNLQPSLVDLISNMQQVEGDLRTLSLFWDTQAKSFKEIYERYTASGTDSDFSDQAYIVIRFRVGALVGMWKKVESAVAQFANDSMFRVQIAYA
ncbi:hypothetical protein ACQKQA_00815 [Pseudomonas sp. NPDC089530]|uniref:hypothetical protein n=1 Tax=Pseudomonas sp. NPDC089530 TaxID=3390651 RepID=UPI003D07ADB0